MERHAAAQPGPVGDAKESPKEDVQKGAGSAAPGPAFLQDVQVAVVVPFAASFVKASP